MIDPVRRIGPAPLVAVGGFGGAMARYGVDVAVGASLQSTLLVNAAGSFALALVLAGWLDGDRAARIRRFVATGFLSSFTTYSTFVVGAVRQDLPAAVGYVLVTYAVGFSAAAIGLAIVASRGDRS